MSAAIENNEKLLTLIYFVFGVVIKLWVPSRFVA